MAHRVIRNPAPEQGDQGPKDEAEMLRAFFRNNGQTLIIAVGACLAIILGWNAYRSHRQSTAMRASQMLMNARSSEELQQVVSQYPGTPTAPIALLTLAARYYDDGQYEMARYAYTQFEQKHSGHSLFEVAALGKAQCLESEGRLDEAIQAYESMTRSKPDHFLAPLAQLGKARTLMQMGRFEDARVAYEDFIAANPDSDWTTLAESSLLFVDKEMRAAARGPTPPAGDVLPFSMPAPEPLAGHEEAMELFPVREATPDLPPPAE